jgi:hypothetical protein
LSAGATPFLRVIQTDGDSEVTLRARGEATADWDEDERVIWRAPVTIVTESNGLINGSLAGLCKALGRTESCDATDSLRRMRSYVISASKYWGWSPSQTPAHIKSRERLAEALARRAEATGPGNGPLAVARAAPRIQFVASRQAPVPFELLPLAGLAREGGTLRDVCRSLPAFLAVMEHTLHTSREAVEDANVGRALLTPAGTYTPRGRAFLRSTKAPQWAEMRKVLLEGEPPLMVDSAPTKGLLDTSELVTRYLLDGNLPPAEEAVSDIHVYAHGFPGESIEDRFKIEFRFDSSWWSPMRVDVLATHFDEALLTAGDTGPGRRPLLWMNCCWAGGKVGRELFSISVELAARGCCVIAPRIDVTANFAIAMARRFYAHVAAKGQPGEAFLAARLEGVESSDNPLGLLYLALGRVD